MQIIDNHARDSKKDYGERVKECCPRMIQSGESELNSISEESIIMSEHEIINKA
ncbi:MAG TPA: hypothetical protein PKG60_14860 [Spirochaetota bacterium]|nr:hypothetical protein [Spirochaetota bacterium]